MHCSSAVHRGCRLPDALLLLVRIAELVPSDEKVLYIPPPHSSTKTVAPSSPQTTSFSLLLNSDIGYGEQETVFPPLTVSFRR